MKSWKSNLLSSTAIPVLIGAGIAVGGAVMLVGAGYASSPQPGHSSLLPVAKAEAPRRSARRLQPV